MSRNRQITDKIRAALNAGNLTTSGISLSAITVHSGADANSLLSADTSGYADGSLHYSTNDKKLFVYDDSEDKYYEISTSNFLGYVPPHGGTNYGYTMAGVMPSGNDTNIIDKFSLASDGNSTDVGDLLNDGHGSGGGSSATHGYALGGNLGGNYNLIQKFPFAADANVTLSGNLTAKQHQRPTSHYTTTNGYITGGFAGPPTNSRIDTIQKIQWSNDITSSDHGNLTSARSDASGSSSTTDGYVAAGRTPSLIANNSIDKFPFANNSGAADTADLTAAKFEVQGQSSETHGYVTGGRPTPPYSRLNVIEKFPFSSGSNSTDVGDLARATVATSGTGVSSTTSGYHMGIGFMVPHNVGEDIQKYSFSSDGNAAGVGDFTVDRYSISNIHT